MIFYFLLQKELPQELDFYGIEFIICFEQPFQLYSFGSNLFLIDSITYTCSS
jgi:hypothetical protein